MNHPRILKAGIAALLTLPVPAMAVDYNWTANPGNGVWTDIANWDANGVPVSGGGNNIYVHAAGPAGAPVVGVALDAGVFHQSIGTAGDAASGYLFGAGTYNLGTLFVGANHDGTAKNNAFGRAFINAGTTLNVGAFHLGEWDGASGHVIQSGGDVNISGQFRLGHWPQVGGAQNSYALNGGTFTMTGPNGGTGEGSTGNIILGIDSSGTFTVNAGTLTGHGITMQTRVAGGGESKFVQNGGLVLMGANGFNTSNPGTLTSYDIQLAGGTIAATANWSSNLEMHLISGGTGIHFDTNGNNVTLSGQLNGAGGLTKDGGGSLILAGATNNYTGATSVTGGTLQLTGSGTAPTTDLTFSAGTTLQIDSVGKTLKSLTLAGNATLGLPAVNAATTTITNALDFTSSPNLTVIPGFFAAPTLGQTFDLFTAGSIVGTPASITTNFGLSHASGNTAVVGNKLVLTITTAGGLLTWSNGAGTGTWQTNGAANFSGADGIFLNNDQVTFGDTAAGNVMMVGTLLPSAVIINSTADYTFDGTGAISGITGVTKSGSGTATLGSIHDYSGGTFVNGGVLNLTGQVGGTGGIRGTVTVNTGGELRATGASGAIFGYTTGQKIDTFNINGGLVNTVGGVNHIWNATVNMTGGELRVNGGVSSLTGDFYEWGNTALNTLASSDTAVVSGRLRVRADASPNLNLSVADGAAATDLLISAGITTQNGNINIAKNGAGTAGLSGGMAIGGQVRTNAGALVLSGATPFTANQFLLVGDSSISLASGANATINSLETGINGVNDTLGGTLNIGSGASLTVQNNFTFGNTLGGGAIAHGILNQTGGTVTVNAPNTDGRNFALGHWATGRGTYNLSAGTLNSTGISMAVSWDGDGTFNLSGTGTANVLGLRFGHNGGRSGVFNLTGGTLNLGAEGIWEQFAGLPNDINLGGGTIKAAAAVTNIFLPAELTGTNGNVIFDTNGNTLNVTGPLTGVGGFTKTGAGRMVLNAANSATGFFSVDGGTLSLQGAHTVNRLPNNGIAQVNNGATLEFGSVNPVPFDVNYIVNAGGVLTNAAGVDHTHIGSIQLNGGTWTTDPGAIAYNGENYQLHGIVSVSGSSPSLITQQGGTAANRGIAWDGNITFDVADVTGDALSDLIVSTELENADTGSAALTKTGGGTLEISFPNSYTGGTTVSDGLLRVNNSTGSGTGSGNVTIDAAGSLAGAGTIGGGGAVNVSVLGGLRPGNSAGTLAFNLGTGTLDISGVNPGSLEFELGTTSDLVSLITGGLAIGSGTLEFDDFAFTQLSGFGIGNYLLFDSGTPISGTLGAVTGGSLGGGYSGSLQLADGGNDLVLNVVPEPGSTLLLLGGLGLLTARRRRAS